MRKQMLAVLALVVLLAVAVTGVATTANAEKTVVGNLEFTADGKFTPKKLPKKKLAPIALAISGKIGTLDGSHPPALKEMLVETDKNGAVNVKGYPVCKSGKIQSTDTKAAKKACKPALVGEGKTGVEILFEESRPVPVKSDLLVFNGGVKGGTTTLYIHAYITVPVPAAIVTTVKIKKIKRGRYGLLATATIPKIAGGFGSVTSFNLKIDKKFTYKGKKVSVLSAKCPDGKLQAHSTAVFSDGTKASADFVRPCVGKN
jgi:hypothetical protein